MPKVAASRGDRTSTFPVDAVSADIQEPAASPSALLFFGATFEKESIPSPRNRVAHKIASGSRGLCRATGAGNLERSESV